MLDFSKVKLNMGASAERPPVKEISGTDIAIIGISLKFPLADSIDEFWHVVKNGIDCIREIPEGRRRDADHLLTCLQMRPPRDTGYGEAAYLEEIDKFDYGYFRLAPKEAALMDPNQRLFLETAWSAIEDAGYGGKLLTGSKTGVYVGYGSDSDYKRAIAASDPESLSMSVSGNVRPIIASRLSYLLDLHGPSLIVDTTCSSSLMAVHLACRALRSGECDVAVAGGIQLHLLPVRQAEIGIEASDGRAKTFDDRSDGTGTGEGVAVIVLKPLRQAMHDKDAVYAVIKGSAANHDGASIGITAPNALAQEEVIASAWMDAGIHPETIGYIEAHGTGTKLGDPIEIDGMQRAFSRFTERKSFCAVGSIKTNIGHLDNSAGIAGLLKAVMALHHKQLPPTLHFAKPNRKISFESSPVYVNERLRPWETVDHPRRCGVSSFGLSGTNCHVVLEEAPTTDTSADLIETDNEPVVFVASAKSREALRRLVSSYIRWLETNPQQDVQDICYTTGTGRGNYFHRLACVVTSGEDLLHKMKRFIDTPQNGRVPDGIYYGEHTIVHAAKSAENGGELTEHEVRELSREAQQDLDLLTRGEVVDKSGVRQRLCALYTKGAHIDWQFFFKRLQVNRVHLPAYPFERRRCWLDEALIRKASYREQQKLTPLLDRRIVSSPEVVIYSTSFQLNTHWVLNEHKIMGDGVLVGTAYLEMVLEACALFREEGTTAVFSDILFLSPLLVKENESYEVQVTVFRTMEPSAFIISARRQAEGTESEIHWRKLVEGKIAYISQENMESHISVEDMKQKYASTYIQPDIDSYNSSSAFEFGPRWNNIEGMYVGPAELLSLLQIPEAYAEETKHYMLHPSLADNALATMPLLRQAIDKAGTAEAIYLPFSYGKLRLYRRLPAEFYSYVRLKGEIDEHSEIVSFDLTFLEPDGSLIAEIEQYSLKKASPAQLQASDKVNHTPLYHEIEWIKDENPRTDDAAIPLPGSVLILGDDTGLGSRLAQQLAVQGVNTIFAAPGGTITDSQDGQLIFTNDEEGYLSLIEVVKSSNISTIIHMLSFSAALTAQSLDEFEERLQHGVYSLFFLVKALLRHHMRDVEIVLVTLNANKVTGAEQLLFPENASMLGLGKVADQEYGEISCRAVDLDQASIGAVMSELMHRSSDYTVAYRDGVRYVEQFKQLDQPSEQSGKRPPLLIKQGVCIVTGGTGGMGLELSRYLAAAGSVKLALISRGGIPERSSWDAVLTSGSDESMRRAVQMIRGMEEGGGEVRVYQGDVSSWLRMESILHDIRSSFGPIAGIIHCAGAAGDGFILTKDFTQFRSVLQPKVQGTWILDRLTAEDELEFFISCSSNTTLMGIPGQGDYTAANAYLDTFAGLRNLRQQRTTTINWPAWKETGMAKNYGVNVDTIFKAISTEQALQAFSEVLSMKRERIVIGELNPGGSVNGKTMTHSRLRLAEGLWPEQQSKRQGKPTQQRLLPDAESVVLQGKGSYTATERTIASIWQQVLGYEEFNVHDHFFEIGGDSILVTRVQSLLESVFPDIVTVADLFSHTSIAAQAEYVDSKFEKHTSTVITKSSNEEENLVGLLRDDIHSTIVRWVEQVRDGHLSVEQAVQRYVRL